MDFKNAFFLILALMLGVVTGHVLTLRSSIPVKVMVQPADAEVSVNVPQPKAPIVNVATSAPEIKVMPSPAVQPIVNVTTPPAVVKVIHQPPIETTPIVKPEVKLDQVNPVNPVNPVDPVYPPASAPFTPTKIEDLYGLADKYITSYCLGEKVDEVEFRAKWLKKYLDGLETSMADGNHVTEQSFLNARVVNKRSCFNLDTAKKEEVVEACFILLRYRDTNLEILRALRDKVTPDLLKKAVAVLDPNSVSQ